MTGGYIKLYRKMTEWEWYDDASTKIVFLHLLLTANYKDEKYRGQVVKAGQVLFKQGELAERLGLSVDQLRYCLKKLKCTEQVTTSFTSGQTLATIVNWDLYQLRGNEIPEQFPSSSPTISRVVPEQTANVHLTKKKEKKVRNNNIARAHARDTQPGVSLGEFKNVFLSEEDLEKLQERFPYDWRKRIERLSKYMKSKGKRYKDHYATILAWAEKDEREQEQRREQEKKHEGRLDWIDEI